MKTMGTIAEGPSLKNLTVPNFGELKSSQNEVSLLLFCWSENHQEGRKYENGKERD